MCSSLLQQMQQNNIEINKNTDMTLAYYTKLVRWALFRILLNSYDEAFLSKTVNGWKPLRIFTKKYILDFWQSSEYSFG